jgi:hypothetical protein
MLRHGVSSPLTNSPCFVKAEELVEPSFGHLVDIVAAIARRTLDGSQTAPDFFQGICRETPQTRKDRSLAENE